MNSEARKESISVRLKNILKQNDVKLWLPPFCGDTSNEESNSAIMDLAETYSSVLNIETNECLKLLLELQQQSLQRLEERNIFRTEGLASFRVKISGQRSAEFSVQLKLSDTTDDLKKKISSEVKVPVQRIKLICNGKVLKNGFVLESQNVKHGNTILALVLQSDINEDIVAETRENHNLLEQTKKDLEYLSRGHSTNKYFSITNQTGSSLDLPSKDRETLVSAMTLHEKGRWALENGQYQLALVFFYEADADFKKCHADILNRVDNYGLLNLDIVWTYLHLKSLQYLSDAEGRLKICEESFYRCYGPNLERLTEIKGTSGTSNERVLFMRLHLLQGIIYHCKNQRDQALTMFEKVETEIRDLKVDFENVNILRNLVDCSTKAAKLALQATYNHLDAAVEYILKRREEKKLVREHERIRSFADQHQCVDGSQINLTVLKQLNDMGYTNLISTYALVDSNNDINQGLLWIENLQKKLRNIYPAYVIDVFMTLEFDDPGIYEILYDYGYKLSDSCIEALVRETPVGKEFFSKLLDQSELLNFTNPSGANPLPMSSDPVAMSSDPVPSTSNGITQAQNSNELRAQNRRDSKEYDVMGRLQNGISNSADAHLISDLAAEENFLRMYKSFLV